MKQAAKKHFWGEIQGDYNTAFKQFQTNSDTLNALGLPF